MADKKIVALATTGPTRASYLPDVPTAQEGGLKDFEVVSWNGMSVPAGTPKPVIDTLNRAIQEALKSPELRQKLQALGVRAQAGTPEELARLLAAEMKRWKDVIVAAKIPQQ